MSHTKEPWCLSGVTHGCFIAEHRGDDNCEEYPVIWGRGEMELEGKREDLQRAVACVNACANLPEPEKNIRELVKAAADVLGDVYKEEADDTIKAEERLGEALAPFEEKK